ncbi:SLATT domain-containing protein [Proteus vulgaris]|uniref:SLATT domain-containing protein n=1 Tax=Proteus vulgaris TaxID=585 RepID=UPI0018E4C15D|nr:SLATT domain-containing protein [Proteus vulgaris]MBI6543139.1 SLATT domain-containing protein [Proteus vulgaris]
MNENILEGQLRECYGRVVYTHKTHEKCADILQKKLSCMKNLQLLFLAISTGSFITTVMGDAKIGAIIGSILSAILLFLNSYLKDYDLSTIAQKHRQAAGEMWLIRERYLSLLIDLKMQTKSIEEVLNERDALMIELATIYCGAPSTNYKAYSMAQKALKELEDMTFSDEEIDKFLPNELKRK